MLAIVPLALIAVIVLAIVVNVSHQKGFDEWRERHIRARADVAKQLSDIGL
jgi:hypothetical protein